MHRFLIFGATMLSLAAACAPGASDKATQVSSNSEGLTANVVGSGGRVDCESLVNAPMPDPGAGINAITCYGGNQGRSLYGIPSEREREAVINAASAAWPNSAGWYPPIDPNGVFLDSNGLHVFSEGRELHGDELVALTFESTWNIGSRPTKYRAIIDEVTVDAHGREMYSVFISSDDGAIAGRPLCPDGDFAYAMRGLAYVANQDPIQPNVRWNTTSHFACRRSAMAKAIRWNYIDDHHYRPATSMAIADYCATGESHTLDKTKIVFFDLENLNSQAYEDMDETMPSPGQSDEPFALEAAWHDKNGALCLSKLRWDSLPPGGFCGNQLPDPRIKGSAGKFCEDVAGPQASMRDVLLELRSRGAVVYSASQFNERALWVWKFAEEGRYFTSAMSWNQNGSLPVPGFKVDIALYKQVARVLANPAPGGGSIRLNRYRNSVSGEYRTTTEPLTGSWAQVESLGWVYESASSAPSEIGAVRLVGWSNDAGTKFLLLRAGQSPPASYVHQRDEGWAFPPLQ